MEPILPYIWIVYDISKWEKAAHGAPIYESVFKVFTSVIRRGTSKKDCNVLERGYGTFVTRCAKWGYDDAKLSQHSG